MENSVRRLKKGTDKHTGMLPLKCFNCDVVGHFPNKFPYKKENIMNNITLKIRRKSKRGEETKRQFSRKLSAPRKRVPHQTKMKSVTVIQKGYYSWK
jgi:hypothetical protein